MKVLYKPPTLIEGSYGERPPMYEGAIVLAEDSKPFGLGWAWVTSRIAEEMHKQHPDRLRNPIVGPFDWEYCAYSAYFTAKINGKDRLSKAARQLWRMSTWQGGGNGGSGRFETLLFAEPWPGDTDYRVDLIVPALSNPYDFGMHYTLQPMRAAYAVASCLEALIGGEVTVK